MKNKILRIGLIGAPSSKKSALINYISSYLRDDYQIFIITSTPSNLLKMGLNNGFMSDSDFEYTCLVEYVNDYNKLNRYLNSYKGSKDIIVFYDTLPSDGEIYLYHNKEALNNWKEIYNDDKDTWNENNCNKIFLLELPAGGYEIVDSSNKYYDTNQLLSIEELLLKRYNQAHIIHNNLKLLEEKAQPILDYIDDYFKPVSYTFNLNDSFNIKLHQFCYLCGWEDNIEYDKQYKYCPMCGKELIDLKAVTKINNTGSGNPDPLGIEARNKMFYVDYEKLPKYISYK